MRLAAALGWYWTLRGAHLEAAVRIGAALDVPGDSPNVPRSICLAMHVLNAGAGGLPAVDPEATLAELQRLRPQAESDEHPVMALLDTVVALLGDDMDAGAAARAHALDHPDPWVHAMVRFMGAAMAENSGDQRGYRDELDAALAGFRQVGDRWGIAMCLAQSAGLSLLDGDRTGAIDAYDEAGSLMRELGASDDAGQTAARKAMVLAAEGELDAARATLLRAQEAAQRSGSALSESLITLGLADVDRLRGDLPAARSRIEQALRPVGGSRLHGAAGRYAPCCCSVSATWRSPPASSRSRVRIWPRRRWSAARAPTCPWRHWSASGSPRWRGRKATPRWLRPGWARRKRCGVAPTGATPTSAPSTRRSAQRWATTRTPPPAPREPASTVRPR